jgi:membrane protein DedA with SNARE-associated domain
VPDFGVVEPARTRPGRGVLALLTIPIVGFIAMANIGNALAPTLVDEHPLLLVALNSQNRNLILTTNALDAWSYYLVGTARLLVSDPLFFLLGYWYGDSALEWMERRTKSFGATLRQWEKGFRRASYPLVFFAPNQWICLFAGAAGMQVTGFFAVNLAGTLARLYLIRRLGDTFEQPIDGVLDWISDHRGPLLVASIALTLVYAAFELRGGGPGLTELEDIAEEADAEHEQELGDQVLGPVIDEVLDELIAESEAADAERDP